MEFVKQFGTKGNGLRLLSLGLGISVAVAFKVREIVPEWGLPVHIRSVAVYPFKLYRGCKWVDVESGTIQNIDKVDK